MDRNENRDNQKRERAGQNQRDRAGQNDHSREHGQNGRD